MADKKARVLASKILEFLGEADYDSPVKAIYAHFQDELGYTSAQIFSAVAVIMASAEHVWGKDWQTKAIN